MHERQDEYLFVLFNAQLIADFSPAAGKSILWKLQHAVSSKVRPRGGERPDPFAQSDHSVAAVDQHDIESEPHAERMNGVGRQNPYPRVRRKRRSAQQANQPAQEGVGNHDSGRESRLLCLVTDGYSRPIASH